MSAGENKLPFPPLYIAFRVSWENAATAAWSLNVDYCIQHSITRYVFYVVPLRAICRAVVTRHSRSSAMTPLEISSSHTDDFLLNFHSNCPWNHLQDIARHGRADNRSVGHHGSNGSRNVDGHLSHGSELVTHWLITHWPMFKSIKFQEQFHLILDL